MKCGLLQAYTVLQHHIKKTIRFLKLLQDKTKRKDKKTKS